MNKDATKPSHALSACQGLPMAHPLRRAAKAWLELLWHASGQDAAGVAARLHVHVRSAQRLLVAYGVRPADPTKDSSATRKRRRRR